MTDTTPRTLPRYLVVGAVLALAFVLLPHVAVAASAGGGAPMPWTGPLESLLNNLSGPTARIIGALMEKELGQPINVVNRTGGSGVVGHQAIASSAAACAAA